MDSTESSIVCRTVGDIRKVLAALPDSTKIDSNLDECITISIRKIDKDIEVQKYNIEIADAIREKRNPNFNIISLQEGDNWEDELDDFDQIDEEEINDLFCEEDVLDDFIMDTLDMEEEQLASGNK